MTAERNQSEDAATITRYIHSYKKKGKAIPVTGR
jgi:hypothetical protein